MKPTQPWLAISRDDLKVERRQCLDEGRDISALEAEFAALDQPQVDEDPALQRRACELLDAAQRQPVRKDFTFVEPSDIGGIRASRGQILKLPRRRLGKRLLLDKAGGAWLGRCCGCMLGKPVESRRRSQIENYLRAQGRWPLEHYFSGVVDERVRKENGFWWPPESNVYVENINCMVEDDDTNYTTVGLAIVEKHGRGFAPRDLGEFWLSNIPIYHVCTAERAAYRNMVNLVPVVDREGKTDGEFNTATFRNPYREWIGAQIRGDFFGYCCPGEPEWAAEMAWRDAAVSHVKNGIYGEMWVAAMLAAAYFCDDVETVMLAGLAQVPEQSRFRRDVSEVLSWRRQGMPAERAIDAIHAKWDESFAHHWCHANSNAQVVAASLLWGEKDFGRTICQAVSAGFDTDCNGATAGSVLGMMLGRKALPERWTALLKDTLHTGVSGYQAVRISKMAAKTVELAGRD